MSTHFENIVSTKLPNAEVEITGVITLDFLLACRAEAVKVIGSKVSIPGFRPGHIPEDVLVKNVGEMHILEEAAEIALGREYATITREAKISAIGRPQIAITKLAPGTPLEFKIKTAVEPEFTLPDYKQIAADVMNAPEDLEVTEKEITDVQKEISERGINVELGEEETIEQKIKENLSKEKEFRAKEKKRLALVERLVKETEVAVPAVLVDAELEKMIGQFKDDVIRLGATWEQYLKEIKKTETEIRSEWTPKALDRAKSELILQKIAESEKIEPSAEDLEKESQHLLEHYPEADPLRVRVYMYGVLRNEQVFKFLEVKK